MLFFSILFLRPEDRIKTEALAAPDFFVDLNLDQVVEAITAAKEEYNLKPFFYSSLQSVEAIAYRHQIMQDLENGALFEKIKSFAQKMRNMREYPAHAGKLHYQHQEERWFLDAVALYCDAVTSLANDLSLADLKSRGFLAFRKYLAAYISSERFKSLQMETEQLKADLSAIHYNLLIKGTRVTASKYEGEKDYSLDVEETFAKFKQGAPKDYRVKFSDWPDMNHVEAQILDLVAELYPDVFARLEDYCQTNGDYLDETIQRFDREIQFYVAYLEYLDKLKRAGLAFCYPKSPTPARKFSMTTVLMWRWRTSS